jgi:hypothetical protein
MVMMFIIVNAAVIVLRETSAQWYDPPFKSPLYPYVQIFGIVSGIVLLVLLGLLSFLSILVIFLIGILIYFNFGNKTRRTGVLRKYGHRPALYLLYKKKNKEKKGLVIPNTLNKNILDGEFVSNAGAIVPLLGNENSPEMLVEIGAAINRREQIQAVNITEVPNQTYLDAFDEDSPKILSLARRVSGLAKVKNISIDFEAVVTHDVSETIDELSNQTNCDWLVMGWNGKAHNGIFVRNPIGWLVTNINSDFALFKDNGVRHIGKVLLALRPGRKDKNFVAIADRVCQFYNASLTLLHVVPDRFGEDTIVQLEEASSRILNKVQSKSNIIILKSENPIEAISKLSASYDLLILGTPEKDNWINVLFGTGKDKFTEKSACSVLRLTMKDN